MMMMMMMMTVLAIMSECGRKYYMNNIKVEEQT
jgi:hypothetical protein